MPEEESPQQWRVDAVSGRGTLGGGGSAVQRLSLRTPDGRVMDIAHRPPAGAVPGTAKIMQIIPRAAFDKCPICLGDEATEKEHVPPGSVGGRHMTWTCESCNNILGTRLEDELKHWFDDALTRVSFSSPVVRGGRRTHPRMLVRVTAADEPVFVQDTGRTGPDIRAMLNNPGEVQMSYTEPITHLFQLALLKQAYLAACLALGWVPVTPYAVAIRADLLAALDAPDRYSVPPSQLAGQLTALRTYNPPQGPPLALVAARDSTRPRPLIMLSLAGTILVSWPFRDLDPRTAPRLVPTLHEGPG